MPHRWGLRAKWPAPLFLMLMQGWWCPRVDRCAGDEQSLQSRQDTDHDSHAVMKGFSVSNPSPSGDTATASTPTAETTTAAGSAIPDNISEAPASRPSPRDDVYRYVSGPWLSHHTIPDDRPVDGTFHKLRDQAEDDVRTIIEAADPSTRIGAGFTSFMDVDGPQGINQAGYTPLKEDLARINVDTLEDCARGLGALDVVGISGFAGYYVAKDAHSTNDAAYLNQGGLTLPDEAYYREEAHRPLVEKVKEHIATMLGAAREATSGEEWQDCPLIPVEFADASPEDLAATIIDFETRLAEGHWSVEDTRDALKTYNPTSVNDLPTDFPWKVWLEATGLSTDMIVVGQPSYLNHVGALVQETDLSVVKLWAGWRILTQRASLLAEDVSRESFNFFGRVLSGATEQRARWKRAVAFLDGAIADDIGREFVSKHFPPEHKETMVSLVEYLLKAYRQRISGVSWMTPQTRERALDKLGTFRAKIAYPDEWKTYDGLEFSPKGEDVVVNARRASAWRHRYEVAKVGHPTDRSEWVAPAQMVNAFYNPVVNDITFPAAILRPPFFNPDADMAQNFGGIGAVIGHEIGHGFDDQGSQFDGEGNLNSWWTAEDRSAFEELTGRLVDQFDGLIPKGLEQRGLTGQHVNGRFTLGENIGDLGGLGIAVVAYRLYLEDRGLTPETSPALPFLLSDDTALAPLGEESDSDTGMAFDGAQAFSAMQRLFLAWANVWRTAIRPQLSAQYLAIDPHSPSEFRCNVISRNVDEFAEAFGVQPGDGMWLAPDDRVQIW